LKLQLVAVATLRESKSTAPPIFVITRRAETNVAVPLAVTITLLGP